MTWFMHGEAPLSVTAVAQTDKPQIYPRVDDDATIILRYPRAQGGPHAFLELALRSQRHRSLRRNRLRHRSQRNASPRASQRILTRSLPHDATALCSGRFVLHYLGAVVRGELQPSGDLTALDTNIVVMQILDAARQSVRTGKTVTLHPLP